MSLNTKAMFAKHFVKVEGEDSKWACAKYWFRRSTLGKVNTGYTNLASRVRTTHPEWLQQQLATQPQITNHTTTRTTQSWDIRLVREPYTRIEPYDV